jgi:hypothetical protein
MKDLRAAAAIGQRVEVLGVSGAWAISARSLRRGAKRFVLAIAIAVAASCATARSPYRACLEVRRPNHTVTHHYFGTVIAERRLRADATEYEFAPDAAPAQVLKVTCGACINTRCAQLNRDRPAFAAPAVVGVPPAINQSKKRKNASSIG